MDEFMFNLLKVILVFIFVAGVGFIRAHLRQSPLADFKEYINYHKTLKKPMSWSFTIMFLIFFLIGISVNNDYVHVLQMSILAGLCTSAAVYGFMIWGANLLKNEQK